jgi:hypothetical protein
MRNIHHKQNERGEARKVVLSLCRIFGKGPVHEVLQRYSESEDVNESENFKPVVRPLFVVKQKAWNGSNKIENKVTL